MHSYTINNVMTYILYLQESAYPEPRAIKPWFTNLLSYKPSTVPAALIFQGQTVGLIVLLRVRFFQRVCQKVCTFSSTELVLSSLIGKEGPSIGPENTVSALFCTGKHSTEVQQATSCLAVRCGSNQYAVLESRPAIERNDPIHIGSVRDV